MVIGDILESIKGASLVIKVNGNCNGTVRIEANGSGVALITMAAASLAQLCTQMGDAASTENEMHKLAKKIIESGLLEKGAED